MKFYGISFIVLFFIGCLGQDSNEINIKDAHVHIMSDSLVAEWQALGIPFSHQGGYYSNIDSI